MRALLVRKPWQLRLHEIDQLTDWEILNVYFRPGEDDQAQDGVYWPVPDKDPDAKASEPRQYVSFDEMYKGRLRQFKFLTEDQIESRWQAYLRKNPGLRKLTQRGKDRQADS